MTQDEIIEMARQAGVDMSLGEHWSFFIEELEAFAKLVAAKEREKVARWQIGSGYTTGHGDTIEDLLVELEWQVRESEREACAKYVETIETYEKIEKACFKFAAKTIRARGEH